MKTPSLLLALLLTLSLAGACAQVKKSPTTGGGPVSSLKAVYFDFDNSNIREDQVGVMNNNGNFLKGKSGMKVNIEGHCDERGTNEYNMALGDRRARAVQSYLVNLGTDPSRMSVVSYGEERPAATCHDESCWWQNRRAEFTK